jgi:hypothetical protein
MNIVMKNINEVNTNVVITIVASTYKSNGDTIERGYNDYTKPRS